MSPTMASQSDERLNQWKLNHASPSAISVDCSGCTRSLSAPVPPPPTRPEIAASVQEQTPRGAVTGTPWQDSAFCALVPVDRDSYLKQRPRAWIRETQAANRARNAQDRFAAAAAQSETIMTVNMASCNVKHQCPGRG
eukprot:2004396-Rhodomonas_salina.2